MNNNNKPRLDGHCASGSLCCFLLKFCDIFSPLIQTIFVPFTTQGGYTMPYSNQPKPDDRSDNAEKLQSMLQNTEENIRAAEESLKFTDSDTQRQQIEEKNERRKESIESFRSEIKDEANNAQE